MTNVLRQPVLVLNRWWQAIGETNAEIALTDASKGARTLIDTVTMCPVTWDEWLALPVRESDRVIHTVRLAIRVPTVIVATTYDRMPKRAPRLDRRGIGERDKKMCAYTNRFVENGTLDHVLPKSRGGKDAWENLVWSDPKVNQMKANRTPEEAGLKLHITPRRPQRVPVCKLIKARLPEWEPFL